MAKRLSDLDKAVREAQKKLPIISAKALNSNLDWACDDKADAYRVGAEEAQQSIVDRLRKLAQGSPATTRDTHE